MEQFSNKQNWQILSFYIVKTSKQKQKYYLFFWKRQRINGCSIALSLISGSISLIASFVWHPSAGFDSCQMKWPLLRQLSTLQFGSTGLLTAWVLLWGRGFSGGVWWTSYPRGWTSSPWVVSHDPTLLRVGFLWTKIIFPTNQISETT